MTPRRKWRTFPAEYKAEVVALHRTTDESAAEIATELDLTESAVQCWSEPGPDRRRRTSRADDQRARGVGPFAQRNRILREERDVLKRATPSSPTRPVTGCASLQAVSRQSWDNAVAEGFFDRTGLPLNAGNAEPGPNRRLRIHRGLLQPPPPTFRPWLPAPLRLRGL